MEHDRSVYVRTDNAPWCLCRCAEGRLDAPDTSALIELYSQLGLYMSCRCPDGYLIIWPESNAPKLAGRIEEQAVRAYPHHFAFYSKIIVRRTLLFVFDTPVCAELSVQREHALDTAVFVEGHKLRLEVAFRKAYNFGVLEIYALQITVLMVIDRAAILFSQVGSIAARKEFTVSYLDDTQVRSGTEIYNGNDGTVIVISDPLLSILRQKYIYKSLDSGIVRIFGSDSYDICIRAVFAFTEELRGIDTRLERLIGICDEEIVVVSCRDDLSRVDLYDLDRSYIFNDVGYGSGQGISGCIIKNDEAVLLKDEKSSVLVCTVVRDGNYCIVGNFIYGSVAIGVSCDRLDVDASCAYEIITVSFVLALEIRQVLEVVEVDLACCKSLVSSSICCC